MVSNRSIVPTILVLLGLLASGPRIDAADIPAPREVDLAGHMKEWFKLTDVQMAGLQAVLDRRISRVDSALAVIDAADEPDVAGFIEQYGDIRKEFERGVAKVLTIDQQGQWEDFKLEVEKALAAEGAARRLADLKAALKLTDEQVTRLEPAMVETVQQKIDLFQELANSGYINVREKRNAQRKLAKLNDALEASINDVLLIDQRLAYKKLKESGAPAE